MIKKDWRSNNENNKEQQEYFWHLITTQGGKITFSKKILEHILSYFSRYFSFISLTGEILITNSHPGTRSRKHCHNQMLSFVGGRSWFQFEQWKDEMQEFDTIVKRQPRFIRINLLKLLKYSSLLLIVSERYLWNNFCMFCFWFQILHVSNQNLMVFVWLC